MSLAIILGSGILSFISLYFFFNILNRDSSESSVENESNSFRKFNNSNPGIILLQISLLLIAVVGFYGVSKGMVDSDYNCEWLLIETDSMGNDQPNAWEYTCLDDPHSGTTISIFRAVNWFLGIVMFFLLLTMLYYLLFILNKMVKVIKRK